MMTGADLPLIIKEFLDEKHTMVRGLAHPVIFEGENILSVDSLAKNSRQQNVSQISDFMTKFGAVKVSPSSLLQVWDNHTHTVAILQETVF